jgi:hypothetical protein
MGLRRDVGRPWRYRTSGGAQHIPEKSDPSSSRSDTPCSRPTALHRLLPTDCPPSSRLNARLACGIARRAADRALYLLPFPIRERRGPESTEVEGGGSAPRCSLPLANDLASTVNADQPSTVTTTTSLPPPTTHHLPWIATGKHRQISTNKFISLLSAGARTYR